MTQQAPQMTPSQARAFSVLRQLPDDVAALAAADVMNGKTVIPRFYWSTARFLTTLTGSTFTIDQSIRQLFSYKVGDSLVPAGFAAGNATRAETNLTVGGSQTEDNADVIIWGMGVEWSQENQQPDLIGGLMRETDLIMSLSSTTKIYLGPIGLYPCPGGLYGQGISKIAQGQTADNQGALITYVDNGYPAQGNCRKLPSPWRWNSIGSNKKDTSLTITATPQRNVSVTGAAIAASAVDPIAFPGWTLPTADATYQDARMFLQVIEISDRSDNV